MLVVDAWNNIRLIDQFDNCIKTRDKDNKNILLLWNDDEVMSYKELKVNARRLGIVKLSKELIESNDMLDLLNIVEVAATKEEFETDEVCFKLRCKEFEEVEEGNKIPYYNITVDNNNKIKFEKRR